MACLIHSLGCSPSNLGKSNLGSLPVWPPLEPPDSWTRNNLLGVAVVDVVVVGVEEDLVTDAGKEDGKETYPCREVESKW